jgi:hypothetical protein
MILERMDLFVKRCSEQHFDFRGLDLMLIYFYSIIILFSPDSNLEGKVKYFSGLDVKLFVKSFRFNCCENCGGFG